MAKVQFKLALHNGTATCEGKLLTHPDFPGVDFIIHRPSHAKDYGWKISHFASGMGVTNGFDTQKQAIAQFLDLAKNGAKRKGLTVEEAIKQMRGQLDSAPILNKREALA